MIDETSAKALYLRSLANMHLASYTDALNDCRQAIKLQPQDKALRDHFEAIKTRIDDAKKDRTDKERKAASLIFSDSVYADKTEAAS